MPSINSRIAEELWVRPAQVEAAVGLLDDGSTVPFIARYRKEATGSLDDVQLRKLEERLGYLRELEERRRAVVDSVEQQGRMDDSLRRQIMEADTKARLEDVYAPYKPRRRTKAQTAREAGLEPLFQALTGRPDLDPHAQAVAFVDAARGVETVEAALEGARAILVEKLSEDAELVGGLRETCWKEGNLASKVVDGKREDGAKFSDYYDFSEPYAKMPSHRILALFRAEKEGVLSLAFEPAADPTAVDYPARVARHAGFADRGRPGDKWLLAAARWAWRTRVEPAMAMDVRARLWDKAEEGAIKVFAENLRDLLLAAPAGARATLGLDPGFRSGVKVAVVDRTGKIVDTCAVYPHEPQRRWDEALAVLGRLCRAHKVEFVAIGNGTASRETDRLAADLMKKFPELKLTKVTVSEAGASVYSASEFASRELPDLDVTLRGAASIARRLQDPLAELVKIDPKSIGVGQYQHDVSEFALSRSLDAVVEDCVNAVGVDVNTASAPLLARVSGFGDSLAEAVVAHRDANGAFRTRESLKEVSRLGPKAFEQAAGFLRILDGDDPLDRSGVHPEAYPVVRRIMEATGRDIRSLMGDAAALRKLGAAKFVDDRFGLPTVADILKELEKPGRDPRPAFKTAEFKDGVEKLSDLRPGMILEGTVTNVAAFGAFVDIGVHQDGLVHVSAMSKTFVKDPRDVAKPGDVVKVKVMEIDAARKRVALSMRMDDEPGAAADRRGGGAAGGRASQRPMSTPESKGGMGALGDALRRAAKGKNER
jgi:uncharacterized protein